MSPRKIILGDQVFSPPLPTPELELRPAKIADLLPCPACMHTLGEHLVNGHHPRLRICVRCGCIRFSDDGTVGLDAQATPDISHEFSSPVMAVTGTGDAQLQAWADQIDRLSETMAEAIRVNTPPALPAIWLDWPQVGRDVFVLLVIVGLIGVIGFGLITWIK